MSNSTQELLEAIDKLSQIIMQANGEWQSDFTQNYAKCLIAYDHHTGTLTYSTHFKDEPLSFLPLCSIEAFYIVENNAPEELIKTIWVDIYEDKET